jgi:5-methylcytosine-specific restriction protein A
MTKRRRISTKERVAIFTHNNGTCHLCGGAITVGQAWEVSHDIPLELGGADEGDNLKPAHKTCHRDHTAKVDQPNIGRAKRREAAHIGAKVRNGPQIKSPGFRPAPKQRKASGPLDKQLPPRRAIYEDCI